MSCKRQSIIKQQAPETFPVDKAGPSSSKEEKFQNKKKKSRKAVTPRGSKGCVAKPKVKCFYCSSLDTTKINAPTLGLR